MDNVSCEKRHKNGRYCRKTRRYRVTANSMTKYVCETHLESAVAFIGGYNPAKTCSILVLLD